MTERRPARARRAKSRPCDTDAGFSLVEGLVALAVFAMAGVGLVQLQTYSISTLRRTEAHALATMQAQNILVRSLASTADPEIGQTSGEEVLAGRTFAWRRLVAPTSDPGIVRVTVQVDQAGVAGAAPVSIDAFRAETSR